MGKLNLNLDEATLLKAYRVSSLRPSYVRYCALPLPHVLSGG